MLTSLTSTNYNYEAIRLSSRVENKCYAQYVLEASEFDRLAWTCRRALLSQLAVLCTLVVVVVVVLVARCPLLSAQQALVCSGVACSLLVAAQLSFKCVKGR